MQRHGIIWSSSDQENIMRVEESVSFNLIFDPISKSALIHFGDTVTWLAGPFANYSEAMSAARRSLGNEHPRK
jgi:hypothetical protein